MRKITLLIVSQFLLNLLAQSQTIDPRWWVTNGPVSSILQNGNSVYLAGEFNYVGPSVPYGTSVQLSNGAAETGIVKPNGTVNKVIPDGSGGWFIGGNFTQVGDQPRNGLARINSNGTLNSWNPVLTNSNNDLPSVWTLALNNNILYIGGDFATVNGQSRNKLASFNISTASLTAWNPNVSDGQTQNYSIVYSIVVNGSIVYVGGEFGSISGQTRNNIAALDATTGAATVWNPGANEPVFCITLSGSKIYAGGWFTNIGGIGRNRIACLDAATGAATAWNPNSDSTVYTIAVNGNTIYAGGEFTTIGGQGRRYIAALNDITGAATAWNPFPSASSQSYFGGVIDIKVSGALVYVAGSFESIGGEFRNNVAALDATTGIANSWNPNTSDFVISIALAGTKAYIGGFFTSVGGIIRNNLAALDASTGTATTWNPNSDSAVFKIVSSGNIIYAIGSFSKIGGISRRYMAAIDATSGTATTWNPNPNDFVSDIDVAVGTPVYVSGEFTFIGGQSRNYIAAINTTNATATSWNPNPSGSVNKIILSGTNLFAAGSYWSIGGQNRNGLAAINTGTGLATAWNPDATYYDSYNSKIAVNNNRVYIANTEYDYTTPGGSTPTTKIVSIDAITGTTSYWNRTLEGETNHFSCRSNNLYIASSVYNYINYNTSFSYIKTIDATNGNDAGWEIKDIKGNYFYGSAEIYSVAFNSLGDRMYLGGDFGYIAGQSKSNFAAFINVPTSILNIEKEQKLLVYPNPVQSGTSLNIIFKDATSGQYQLSVFNTSGAKLLTRSIRLISNMDNTGISIPKDWQPGTYFAILTKQNGNISGRFKIVVVE